MARAGRISQKSADLFALMILAGLSPARALALRWSEIEPQDGRLILFRRLGDLQALRRLVYLSWQDGRQGEHIETRRHLGDAIGQVSLGVVLCDVARAILSRRSRVRPFQRHVFPGRKRAGGGVELTSARSEFDAANWTRKALLADRLPARAATVRAARMSAVEAGQFSSSSPMVFPHDEWAHVRARARAAHLKPEDLQWWRLSRVLDSIGIGAGLRLEARMLYGVQRDFGNQELP